MPVLPYRGPTHILYTDLSAEECLRRLQRNVEPGAFTEISGWAHLTSDHSLVRKIDGQHFTLYKHPRPVRGVTWIFRGSIRRDSTHTVIQGQYGLDPWYQALLALAFGCLVFIVGYIVYQGIVDGRPVQDTFSQASPFIIAIVLLIGVLVWRNRVEQANERYILHFLREYFRAYEQLPKDERGHAV